MRNKLTFVLRRSCRAKWLVWFLGAFLLVRVFLVLFNGENLSNPVSGRDSNKIAGISQKINDVEDFSGNSQNVSLPSPLRRGPVPSVVDLDEGKSDEENVAQEVIDTKDNLVVKIGDKGKLDDNAAKEEQSAEAWVKKNNIAQRDEKVKPLGQYDEESFHQLPEQQKDLPEEKYGDFSNLRNRPLKDKIMDEKLISLNQNQGGSFQSPDLIEEKNDRKRMKNALLEHKIKKENGDIIFNEDQVESFHELPGHQKEPPEEKYNNWRNLTLAEINHLSVLGRRLYLHEKLGQEQDRIFTIHIWKFKKHLERRLFKTGSMKKFDPFESCSVSNCKITSQDAEMKNADAVLFHLHRISGPPVDVQRNPGQLWVWMSDESPHHVFMVAKDRILSHYNGFFNWSMTYRIESDVPVPYGRTVPLPKDKYLETVHDYYAKKKKDVAVLGSNCGGVNQRYKYISELKKYIPIDVYGRCGNLKCEGHFFNDCGALNDYKFYLAFENSNCDDYITEKTWWNAYSKGAVPIVMGPPKFNYQKQLPPNSFIHVDDYSSPQDLARYIKYLLDNPGEYQKYHMWRRRYQVLNEHGYFQSPVYHMCRLCEALNYNHKRNQRADLDKFFDKNHHCYAAKWHQKQT